jgi:hypothetical protein
MKTSIVSGCNCGPDENNEFLYNNIYPDFNILEYQSAIAQKGIIRNPCDCTDILSGDPVLVDSLTGEKECVFPNEYFLNSLV